MFVGILKLTSLIHSTKCDWLSLDYIPLHRQNHRGVNLIMLQYSPPYFVAYVLFIIFFFAIVIVATLVRSFAPRVVKRQKGSLIRDWWEWMNTKDPAVQTRAILTPGYVTREHLESWSCPICGATLSKDSLHQLEYGYDIECEYCGATIRSPRMPY
jgi:DNA-directed RNA polymerase subunit RPC12/RpoP